MTREEAISILKAASYMSEKTTYGEYKEAVNMAISALKAQTDGDTISRQAAIELADELKDGLPDDERIADAVMAHNEGILEYQTALSKLPSAQPEQHTCVNCGRTANNGGWYADGRTRCPIEEHYALPKDGYCHLWEKRNVTDDDYPERREE
jgi:hypothetical protein